MRLTRYLTSEIQWNSEAERCRALSAQLASGVARANVKRRMHSLGISREELSALSGLSDACLRQVLDGPGALQVWHLVAIVNQLGMRVGEVLGAPTRHAGLGFRARKGVA